MTVWISVMEAATRLGVTHQTVRNRLAAGRLENPGPGGYGVVQPYDRPGKGPHR